MTDLLPARRMVQGETDAHRRTIRYAAASLSAATAMLYFGIGLGVLRVVDETTASAPGMFEFGLVSGAAFVLGGILLFAFDRRSLWLLGAVFQVGVIVMYIAVAPQRTPPVELWGILIKVLQATILVALVYLAVRPPARGVTT